MSVPKGDRKRGKLEVLVMLNALCTYTIQICKNEKNFPKRDRWILTQPIVREAVDAYANARKANAIRVVTMDDYRLRREYQLKTRCNIEALMGLIEIAYTCLSLEPERVEYWTGIAIQAEEKLAAWRAGDRKRYAELFKEGSNADMAEL